MPISTTGRRTTPPPLAGKRGATQIPTRFPTLPLHGKGAPGKHATTLAEVCANQRGTDVIVAYPTTFDLLKEDGGPP